MLVERVGGDAGASRSAERAGRDAQPPSDQHQLDEQDAAPIMRADRQIAQEAAAQLGEVDVEHHHDEQEQHRDRADIDDDQDHRQELGAEQHEQRRPR